MSAVHANDSGLGANDHGTLLGLGDDDHAQYLLLSGRSGGQIAIGGTGASEELGLRGSTNANLGLIRASSPIVFDDVTPANALSPYSVLDNSTNAFTAGFIGGTYADQRTVSFTNALFIYETLRGSPTITSGVNPSFAAFTLFQALPVLAAGSGATHHPLQAIVLNAGPAFQNGFSGTRTAPGATAVNFAPNLRPLVSGATIAVTNTTGMLVQPQWNTVAGSTANFGTIRGLWAQSPAQALFGSSAGSEVMTAYYAVDVEAIALGAAPAMALRSSIAASASNYFLQNNGGAQSYLGTGTLAWGTSAPGDIVLSRLAANVLTFADGDSLRITTGNLFFGPSGGVSIQSTVNAEAAVTSTRLGFGTGAPSGANWAYAFAAAARSITVGGDFANCLNTSGAVHTVNAALGTFYQWTINAPTGTLGTGSVVDGGVVRIQGNPNLGTNRYGLYVLTSPSGGTLNYCARFAGAAGVRVDGLFEHQGSTLGFYGATPTTQAADPGALTDSTGGTADNTCVDVATVGVADPAKINDNFADLIDQINALRAMLSATAGGVGVCA